MTASSAEDDAPPVGEKFRGGLFPAATQEAQPHSLRRRGLGRVFPRRHGASNGLNGAAGGGPSTMDEDVSEERREGAASRENSPGWLPSEDSSGVESETLQTSEDKCSGRQSPKNSAPSAASDSECNASRETSTADMLTAKLRRLALRTRSLVGNAPLAEDLKARWCSPPASPRSLRHEGAGGAPGLQTHRVLQRLSESLDAITETAALAATEVMPQMAIHSHATEETAALRLGRKRPTGQEGFLACYAQLAESQGLSEELNAAKQKCFNSEAQLQQLAKYKNYQTKFFACQGQVARLQFDMDTLRRGFDSLEALHKSQEAQLQQSTETVAALKQRLRATADEAHPLEPSRSSPEPGRLLRHTMLSQDNLSRVSSFSSSSTADFSFRGSPCVALASCDALRKANSEALRATKGPPTSHHSFNSMRPSALRHSLRASLSQRQQRPLPALRSFCSGETPSAASEWHSIRILRSAASKPSETTLSRTSSLVNPERGGDLPRDECQQSALSLFEELAATAEVSPQSPSPSKPPDKDAPSKEALSAGALQHVLQIVAMSPVSLEELEAHGVGHASLLQVTRLRKNMALQGEKSTPTSPLAAAPQCHSPAAATTARGRWLPSFSISFRDTVGALWRLVARGLPQRSLTSPPESTSVQCPSFSPYLLLGASLESTCSLIFFVAVATSALWLRLPDSSVKVL
ncbi:hypothetical protein cyc_07871 [Cyclospora cayetanensis]|uniref:Uncharacterized protein n=1 Tax=Cyclospora cayetanensis TaxID=88456 RepID=A0A1D3D9T9_9EIME|nr:hypothetical protein cyc_07871 [Cyclospora cayetanensis]